MYCSKCGKQIDDEAVVCVHCGVPTINWKNNTNNNGANNVIVNNVNQNTNAIYTYNAKNKWIAFLLCLFLGVIGGHKFYEGKILMGIIYIFTGGLFGIGVIVDLIAILFKPNPYCP